MGISGRLASTTGYALLAATIFAQSALAETCSGTIRLLAQPRDGLSLNEKYAPNSKS